MSLVQKLKGNLYLGYRALIAHPLRMLMEQEQGPGEQRFLRNYAGEGNIPLTLEDREVLRGASRCIACGLCDGFDGALASASRTVHLGASLFPVSLSRATPDLPHARADVEAIAQDQLWKSEAVCPTRVPLRAIAGYLKRKLEELDRMREEFGTPEVRGPTPAVPPPPEAPRSPRTASRLSSKAPDRAVSRDELPPLPIPVLGGESA